MYRSIEAKFWTDPKIRELSPSHKLLFLYQITSAHSHVSGIYYIPKVLMQHETGLSMAEVEKGIDTLSKHYLSHYDTVTEVVWVRKMFRYQHHGTKLRQAVATQLESLHKCQLIKDFLEEYSDINIPYQYPIDTRAPVYKEQEQEQEQEKEELPCPKSDDEEGCSLQLVSSNPVWPSPEALAQLYNDSVPGSHPKVRPKDLSPARIKKAKQYLKQFPEYAFWQQAFSAVFKSSLLKGSVKTVGHQHFVADFDWFLQVGKNGIENCVKAWEGKYDDAPHATGTYQPGDRLPDGTMIGVV